jgi:hypothetical protein
MEIRKMSNKSCFNCLNATITPGYPATRWDPECPDEADCEFMPEYDDYEAYNTMHEKCGHYNPVLVGGCCKCHKYINEPAFSWNIWACTYDSVPCCSEKCKNKLEDEFRQETEQEDEYYETKVTLICPACLTRINEEEVTIDDIEEGMLGEDNVTFTCPKCNKSVTSKRFG